jgi:uncharacterized protein involved in exopolysaccharide biosynthesis
MSGANDPHGRGASQVEIDLLALLKCIKRRWILLTAFCLAGASVGYSVCLFSPKKYRSIISFAFQSDQAGASRLAQLALLAGASGMKTSVSPYITNLPEFAETREVTSRMAGFRYHDSALSQILAGVSDVSKDSLFKFHSKLVSMFQIKKKEEVYRLTFQSGDPVFAKVVADSLFGVIVKIIEEKRRKTLGQKLEFTSALVEKYRGQFHAASDRLKNLLLRNVGINSPDLIDQRSRLMLEQQVEQEKYLFSVKEQEDLRIQLQQSDTPLVILEEAFVAPFPYYPSKPIFMLGFLLGFLFLYVTAVATLDKKAWIKAE